MISKVILVILVSIAATSAFPSFHCHPSCSACVPNSNICLGCVDSNSQMDQINRSCPCNPGYYTSQLSPFQCTQYINEDTSGNDISQQMNACYLDIALKTKDLQVRTNCFQDIVNSETTVHSNVSLNFHSICINPCCIPDYTTKVQFQFNNVWADVPSTHFTAGPNGSIQLHYNLIDFYAISSSSFVSADQFLHIANFRIYIGHPDNFVRVHKWQVHVYTNRNQVEIFNVDVDIQETEGCDDCIVVADLDTVARVCTDWTCSTTKPNNDYTVGDEFFAEIKFADSSYTKQLQFVSLVYKNDKSQIFNFSSITTYLWINNTLRIRLTLVDPSIGGIIQVRMLISPLNSLRTLQSTSNSDSTAASVSLSANVFNALVSTTPATTNDSAKETVSSNILIASLLSLFAFFLL